MTRVFGRKSRWRDRTHYGAYAAMSDEIILKGGRQIEHYSMEPKRKKHCKKCPALLLQSVEIYYDTVDHIPV